MAELLVVGFEADTHRASGVLDKLRVLNDRWILDLRDAVAIHRETNGALKMDQSYRLTGYQGAGLGGTLGLLIGVTLALPFTAGASASVAAGAIAAAAVTGGVAGAISASLDVSFWKDQFGLPEDFVRDVSSLVQPGDSAVFAILESADASRAVVRLQEYGGTILQTTLSRHQQETFDRALRGER